MSDYWEDNGIKKPQAVVVCAACRCPEVTLCGARHWDRTMRTQWEKLSVACRLKYRQAVYEQGFINQFGEFLTREEAMIVAIEAGQAVDIKRGCGGDKDILFSEGLY